mgnify:CR=1 FL=1
MNHNSTTPTRPPSAAKPATPSPYPSPTRPQGAKSSLVLGLDEHDGGVLKHVFERLEEPGGHGAVDDAMIAR